MFADELGYQCGPVLVSARVSENYVVAFNVPHTVKSPDKQSVGPQSLVDLKQKYFDVALKFALNAYFNSAFVQPFIYALKSEICEFLHFQILL
jgi:hypothetical protein